MSRPAIAAVSLPLKAMKTGAIASYYLITEALREQAASLIAFVQGAVR